jgi:hypothetical protein
MEGSNRFPDEFDTNLELLKIAYKVEHKKLNKPRGLRKATSYSIKSERKNTRRQTKG